ncbi:MAG: hypothetical protein CL816_07090 [Coxiellaceae bacterium]|nr:hypothetical protein [Coxiellaceae bacterium]|tara:strand:+ start:4587 stop:5072 length:486 start_codon:yes stop_codon:yes gene_type:complete
MATYESNRTKKWPNYVIGIIVCLLLGMLSGYFSGSGPNTWYQELQQPSFTPPSWLFGPVWTLLYIMIGVTAGYLWSQRNQASLLFKLFVIQFILNLIWSPIFFGFHQISLAAATISLLWICLIILLVRAAPSHRCVTYLLLPYTAWVSFAMVLNITLALLN